ncbi:hypothetical protein QQX98_000024 [Neonectria punicea]|uniref:LysM domain-containing protein n=1 Tax=Neonectria punicea TaxID=979145 RepID=A0ABR1HV48_9HYPO
MRFFISHLLFFWAFLSTTIAQDSKPGGPVHDGQPKNCNAWHTVKEGDDCETVPKKYYISKKQFLVWNPAVSEDCLKNFWLKSAYCVGVDESMTGGSSGTSLTKTSAMTSKIGASTTQSTKDTSTSASESIHHSTTGGSTLTTSNPGQITSEITTTAVNTTYSVRNPVSTWNITTPTTDMTWPPKATQSGQPEDCNNWHLVLPGSTCVTVLNRYSAFMKKEDFFKWNPEVHTDCSGLFVDYWVCVGIRSNATASLEWSTSTPDFTPPPNPTTHKPTTLVPIDSDFTPEPTHGPMPANCQNFHQAEADESCRDILKTYNYLSEEQFFEYNPALKKNCDGLWKDTWYCVGLGNELPMPPIVTTTPSSVPSGSSKDCKSWYYTTGGETCHLIVSMFGTFDYDVFVSMNPSVLDTCEDIKDNTWYCVAKHDTPTTRTGDAPTPTSPATGMPTQTGTSADCDSYWLVSKKDTCKSIAKANGVTQDDLIAWNKALGLECDGLKPDYYLCVGVDADSGSSIATSGGTTVTRPTTTSTVTSRG